MQTQSQTGVNGYFTVRLTVRVEPPPPYGQLFVSFWRVQKTGVFWSKTHLLKVRAKGADPLPPYGQPDREKSSFCFTSSLNSGVR